MTCRSLAHLYHYYLHGEKGNVPGVGASKETDLPQIQMECIIGTAVPWQCQLANVADDLESSYLKVYRQDSLLPSYNPAVVQQNLSNIDQLGRFHYLEACSVGVLTQDLPVQTSSSFKCTELQACESSVECIFSRQGF